MVPSSPSAAVPPPLRAKLHALGTAAAPGGPGRHLLAGLVLALTCGLPAAAEVAPVAIDPTSLASGNHHGIFSERTRVVALSIDRDGARLIAHTIKARPHTRSLSVEPARPFGGSGRLQVEVILLGAAQRYTHRIDVGPICLLHGPEHPPHVEGDTVTSHRETFLVELPDIGGLDRIEVAVHRDDPAPARETMAMEPLDAERFLSDEIPRERALIDPAGAAGGGSAAAAVQQVTWPEALGDPDRVTTYGKPGEGDRRINVTIIPDGYTYAEKGLLKSHADALVEFLRNKTPFKEHDPFINYNLVYAYSTQSGTDECDCGIVRNTAFGTGFIYVYGPCGAHANRCLFYGTGCDSSGVNNMLLAEMRAPFHDASVVMVNTARYGGCGGGRAVYAAGNASAMESAAHELGHTLAVLADEYQGRSDCGWGAGEVNTSANSTHGAWPEWISTLGPPKQGAQNYNSCIYRPAESCLMRSLDAEYCPVCNQRWSIMTFGHPRIAGRAPVTSVKPPTQSSTACLGFPHAYRVGTRFSTPGTVTNSITWTHDPPGLSEPVLVGSGEPTHVQTFSEIGEQELRCEVIADTNFVKPEKHSFNRSVITWKVNVVDGVGDSDGDGCAPAGDCNENDGAVYPGAPQICDGVNNDCNEASWPSVAATNDGDDDADAFTECSGDCNDTVASIHPGAHEINDGIDNQCPGEPGAGSIDEIPPDASFTGPHPSPFCWAAQTGTANYTVARSGHRLMTADCHFEEVAANCLSDDEIPPLGGTFYYLVRAERPFAGSWGVERLGAQRTVSCSVICGNDWQEGSEVCDGTDLGGKSCADFGFRIGPLVCRPSCDGFDASGCRIP
jgi:hypothetical protein